MPSLSIRLISLLASVAAVAVVLALPAAAPAQTLELPCLPTQPLLPVGDCEDEVEPQPEPEPAPAPAPTPAPTQKKKAKKTKSRGCADANLIPGTGNIKRLSKATLCLLNRERTRRGMVRLKRNASLDGVATKYSRLMVSARFFDHVSPRGSTLVKRVQATTYLHGLRRWTLGENLAWGTGSLGSPAETVRAWMRSAGHRHNILNRSFREIGLGATVGIPRRLRNAPTGATYAHVFGRRVR